MAKAKAKVAAPAGLSVPRAECPFSGEPLVFAEVTTLAAGHKMPMIQVRGDGWVSTKLFHSRAEAEYFFSRDRGVPPAFPNPVPRIEVSERTPPAREQLEVEGALRDAAAFGEESAKLAEPR